MTFKEYIIERETIHQGSIINGETLIDIDDAVEYYNGYLKTKKMNKEQIVKILESYVFDNVGETRPYIDPESINDIATEIVSSSNVIPDVNVSCNTCKYKAEEHDKFCDSCFDYLKYEKKIN